MRVKSAWSNEDRVPKSSSEQTALSGQTNGIKETIMDSRRINMNRPTLYLFVIMFLTPYCYGSVSSKLPVPAPTPPATPVIRPKAVEAQLVIIECPKTIQIGPLAVPDGWQSLGPIGRVRQLISVDTQNLLIVCSYGTSLDTDFLAQYYAISRAIPAGYECRSGSAIAAVCKPKKRVSR